MYFSVLAEVVGFKVPDVIPSGTDRSQVLAPFFGSFSLSLKVKSRSKSTHKADLDDADSVAVIIDADDECGAMMLRSVSSV